MTSKSKRRRSIIDGLFGSSLFDEAKLFNEFPESGYSISVTQTPEGTKVRAKVGKDTDVNMLRKQLQQRYPNAKVEIEGGGKEPLIREISTKFIKKENNEKQDSE
ncbi:MAG: hypothetical protein OEY22_06040 [Candidatus Bathyarchaeota archaeon]|nr:hypothetical protein [Candidatus Bathyarchaeota archaeon]MDH5788906.1 hypothetical protein [Candidatus Bathyarchaeota archaeon]